MWCRLPVYREALFKPVSLASMTAKRPNKKCYLKQKTKHNRHAQLRTNRVITHVIIHITQFVLIGAPWLILTEGLYSFSQLVGVEEEGTSEACYRIWGKKKHLETLLHAAENGPLKLIENVKTTTERFLKGTEAAITGQRSLHEDWWCTSTTPHIPVLLYLQ